MKKRYKILITVIAFILIAAAAFTIWLLNPYQAVEEASAVIEKNLLKLQKRNGFYSTVWKEIKGGNHSQFGYYGFQRGDNKAEITREKQQQEILAAILTFIE